MKSLYDNVSVQCSKITTQTYSTSFSLGIKFLGKRMQNPIYSIYGFVRLADEIVDSFHGYDKATLLKTFQKDTYDAIENKISLNPILNSFQEVVHTYSIDIKLINTFLESMEMDLRKITYNDEGYKKYIFGSAEAVGLMCLFVFTEGDLKLYEKLKPSAMKLGSAFQKVNFLRDLKDDYVSLGRTYFPNVDMGNFGEIEKKEIEMDIEAEFVEALVGIRMLHVSSRGGVYLAYVYYQSLFKKIKGVPAKKIITERIRINSGQKVGLMLNSMFKVQMNII